MRRLALTVVYLLMTRQSFVVLVLAPLLLVTLACTSSTTPLTVDGAPPAIARDAALLPRETGSSPADAVVGHDVLLLDVALPPVEQSPTFPSDAAGSSPTLRVATLNCHCLLDNPSVRARGIAEAIATLDPDVVGLQEICQTASNPGDNFAQAVAAELKSLTGQDWAATFERTHASWGVYDEGVGLLAPKGTIVTSGALSLPQGQGPFPRKVAWARLASPRGAFFAYSTHLTISSNPLDRAAQVAGLRVLIAQHAVAGLPQVVLGDFNDWYGSSAIKLMTSGSPMFTDAWGAFHPGSQSPGLTCCGPSLQSRIDYVFLRSMTLQALQQVNLAFDQPRNGVALSDHRGLFVVFAPR